MKTIILISLLLCSIYVPTSHSHGTGGGTYSYKKHDDKQIHKTEPTKPIIERMNFSLEIREDMAKLWVFNHLNEPMDTSLADATILIINNGLSNIIKMMPTEEGYVIGTIPEKISETTKLDITLRMPGERPILLVFIPHEGTRPTTISQQSDRIGK